MVLLLSMECFYLCVSIDEILWCDHNAIEMKPLQQSFHMVLFVFYYVVPTFLSVDEIL